MPPPPVGAVSSSRSASGGPCDFQLAARTHERALARVAHHEVLRVRGRVEPVDDPEIADPLAPGVGQCPPPALRQRIGGARRPVDAEARARPGRARSRSRPVRMTAPASARQRRGPSSPPPASRRWWPHPPSPDSCAAVTSGAAIATTASGSANQTTDGRRATRAGSFRIRVTRRTSGESLRAIVLAPAASPSLAGDVHDATIERQRARARGELLLHSPLVAQELG